MFLNQIQASSAILDICNFIPLWHRNVVNWMPVAIHSKNRSTHSNSVCRSLEQNAACIVHLFWSQCVVTTFRQKAKINHSIFTFFNFIQVQTYYAPTSFKLHNLGPTFQQENKNVVEYQILLKTVLLQRYYKWQQRDPKSYGMNATDNQVINNIRRYQNWSYTMEKAKIF